MQLSFKGVPIERKLNSGLHVAYICFSLVRKILFQIYFEREIIRRFDYFTESSSVEIA